MEMPLTKPIHCLECNLQPSHKIKWKVVFKYSVNTNQFASTKKTVQNSQFPKQFELQICQLEKICASHSKLEFPQNCFTVRSDFHNDCSQMLLRKNGRRRTEQDRLKPGTIQHGAVQQEHSGISACRVHRGDLKVQPRSTLEIQQHSKK